MSILEAVVLGLIQGITELLPISSSGHLIVLPELFGWNDHSLLFDVVLHLGTLVAIITMLWKDVLNLTTKRIFQIGLATIPVLAFGYAAEKLSGDSLRTVPVIAVSLIFWGLVLWAVDAWAVKNKQSKLETVGWKQTLAIGCAQAIAMIPGTSRSGITMTAGMGLGLTREAAARFSFLLSIPAIAAAGAYELIGAAQNGADESLVVLLVGFLVAMGSGMLAIQLLLVVVRKASFAWFAWYRLALGVALLIWWAV